MLKQVFCRSASITYLVEKPTVYFFALNQAMQSMGKVRTNSMENNIQHRCKYCLDMWTIVLEVLLEVMILKRVMPTRAASLREQRQHMKRMQDWPGAQKIVPEILKKGRAEEREAA